jgi:hypothetical protein
MLSFIVAVFFSMGGHHKKFTRKEKSKVKLKTKKTVLTKAQNITDTSFRVRKIVLKEQLKSGVLNEPQTRRKLNVKASVSRNIIAFSA